MAAPKMKFTLLAFFAGLLLFVSCTSAEKLVDSGNYDQAIDLAIRKLAGKKQKKVKYVLALEEAFARVTQRDMQLADRLKADGDAANWESITDIYRRIGRRQQAIEPLLPLIDKEGIKASFQFVRVAGLERESKEKAAAYLYDHARELLDQARNGDRLAARQAYRSLDKISKYYRQYRDRETLMGVARELGISHILVKMENQAPVILPIGFEEEITRFGVRDLDSKWRVYHNRRDPGIDYDYQAVMRLTDIRLSPEVVRERQYEDARELEDGFDYVLDENGNVAKDTLGNDIKVVRKVWITAQVFEVYQSKVATINGRLDLIDLKTKELVDSAPLGVEAVFENYASTFRGDERALSKESRRRIGNRPVPFPTNEDLMLTAAEQIKPVVKERISRTRKLI
jgi:tetratricopeptide (TPR) repeat protein